ncbi:RNA 3'-terminal phosphate cyclase domain-containing protein [Corynascus similis CBS 632.67]
MKDRKPIIELDGRTGEGGGQLVRIASALAAVASQPIRITHVRGNREGSRGGGLKSQHVTAIDYLAKATAADVTGLSIGSQTLEFRPQLRPSQLAERHIQIAAESPAASTMLIFQAVFPYLLFAGNDKGEPVTLEISGGTNVSWSLSFEYLDQVLLPALHEAFGIAVERKLLARGWSLGRQQQRGKVEFKFKPLKPGETLRPKDNANNKDGAAAAAVYRPGKGALPVVEDVEGIDISMIVPLGMRDSMMEALVEDLEQLFPDVEVDFKINEDSGDDSRIYVLLVAKAGTVRWGRDVLTSMPKKAKGKGGMQTASSLSATISRRLCKDLYEEVSSGGVVDEFLQDQLVIFQALADGRTSFPRGETKDSLEQAVAKLTIRDDLRKDRTDKPFGEGSDHTTTARWVVSQLLPGAEWYNGGLLCQGVGMHMPKK